MGTITRHWLAMAAALLVAAPLSAQSNVRAVGSATDLASATASATAHHLYTVRVSAFADPDGHMAQRLAASLRAFDVPVWIEHDDQQGQRVSRMRIGVVTSPAQAKALQRALQTRLDWPTYVVPFRNAKALPPSAVPATLTFIHRY